MQSITSINNSTPQELAITSITSSSLALEQRFILVEQALNASILAERKIVSLIEINANLMVAEQELSARNEELEMTHQAQIEELTSFHGKLLEELKTANEQISALKNVIDDLKKKIITLKKQADELVSPTGAERAFKSKFPHGFGGCTII